MRKVFVAVLAAVALAGCGKSDADKSAKKDDVVITIAAENHTYGELSSDDVLVRINGAELTKAEVERQIEFRIALAKMRPGKKLSAGYEARMRDDMRRTCDRQFIMQELMKAYAQTNGLTVTEVDRVPMREHLAKLYSRGESYRKLVQGLSRENKIILGEGVDREIWAKKGREKLIADNMTPVSSDEIAKRREYFEKYNERAHAALAKTWSDATNAWKKATGGYPFEKLVEIYDGGDFEHASADADWGDLKASDFKDDPGLFHALTQTPEGCIQPPFEGDNGVMVIKMLKITPPDPAQGRPEALYRLAKIHFELPELWESQTDAELRADLETLHTREAYARGLETLVNASKIDYPCGTNLFPRVSRRRAPIPAEARNRLPRGVKIRE